MTHFSLETLFAIIQSRSNAHAEDSYTKNLLDKGAKSCAAKFGEEAIELIIAVSDAGDHQKTAVIHEAADVLYHLLVVLESCDVSYENVLRALEKRTALSGLEEKARRKT